MLAPTPESEIGDTVGPETPSAGIRSTKFPTAASSRGQDRQRDRPGRRLWASSAILAQWHRTRPRSIFRSSAWALRLRAHARPSKISRGTVDSQDPAPRRPAARADGRIPTARYYPPHAGGERGASAKRGGDRCRRGDRARRADAPAGPGALSRLAALWSKTISGTSSRFATNAGRRRAAPRGGVGSGDFLLALRSLAGLAPLEPARLSTWILTIASRRALDELGRGQRGDDELDVVGGWAVPTPPPGFAERVPAARPPGAAERAAPSALPELGAGARPGARAPLGRRRVLSWAVVAAAAFFSLFPARAGDRRGADLPASGSTAPATRESIRAGAARPWRKPAPRWAGRSREAARA